MVESLTKRQIGRAICAIQGGDIYNGWTYREVFRSGDMGHLIGTLTRQNSHLSPDAIELGVRLTLDIWI